jgi:hypothetical protein
MSGAWGDQNMRAYISIWLIKNFSRSDVDEKNWCSLMKNCAEGAKF